MMNTIPQLGQLTNRIVAAVDKPMTILEVAEVTGIAPGVCRRHLYRLSSRGYLSRPYRGVYAPVGDAR